MKRIILAVVLGAAFIADASAQAQRQKFTDTKLISSSSVEQGRTTTSWSSALALFQSDLQRQGKGTYDLSAMWIARHVYFEKVLKYVRMRGTMDISAGGSWEDAANVVRKYGIVPTEAYLGATGRDLTFREYELLDGNTKVIADLYIDGGIDYDVFLFRVNQSLDLYFGRVPETFTYGGIRYTPEGFRNMLGLNIDDYVCFTSFTHHPFYTWFAIEMPGNWAWGQSYNLPQETLLKLTEGAINQGYAVWWGVDMSDPNENMQINSVSMNAAPTTGATGLAKFVSVGPSQRAVVINRMLGGPLDKTEHTQAERQKEFDSFRTCSESGMILTGLAVDGDKTNYFKFKNSWSENGNATGYHYVTYQWFKYKTIEVAMHKDALTRDLKSRLGYQK